MLLWANVWLNIFILSIVFTYNFAYNSAYDYDWDRLHSCRNPETLKSTVQDYCENFPCEDCRVHFREMIDSFQTQLDMIETEKDCLLFTCMLHNTVNERLGKPLKDCQ
tara:strand:- start:384 stop:707 length:324 start_codon:yes stop_codon:yes gene_type:complete